MRVDQGNASLPPLGHLGPLGPMDAQLGRWRAKGARGVVASGQLNEKQIGLMIDRAIARQTKSPTTTTHAAYPQTPRAPSGTWVRQGRLGREGAHGSDGVDQHSR
jgi:hypothetical protein